MKKALFTSAFAAISLFAGETKTFSGVITDSMCVRDHAHMNVGPDAECTKACVRSSKGRYKYVLFDGKNSYKLSDQETPEKFAAKKVNVTGTLYEKTGVIKVDKIEAAK
jgi:hypothetical protein